VDPTDLDLLRACFEARARQLEMFPLIARAVGVPEPQVFDAGVLEGRFVQRHRIAGGPWKLFFHGFECDLMNHQDGRFLRYDFGPSGRVDCVSAWGVLQFVMTSKTPWREFPALRARLAQTGPPYDYLSGDFRKVGEVWDRLAQLGCFEPADPGLVEFQARHTRIGPDGISYVSYPEGTPGTVSLDCAVAGRRLLTARAGKLLKSAEPRAGTEPGNDAE
jgi:hypothetical protein